MAVAPDGAKGPPGFALPHQTELRGLYGLGLALLSINGLSWPPPESHFGILTSYIYAATFSMQVSVTTPAMGCSSEVGGAARGLALPVQPMLLLEEADA